MTNEEVGERKENGLFGFWGLVERCVANLPSVSAKSILPPLAQLDARASLHLARLGSLPVCNPPEEK